MESENNSGGLETVKKPVTDPNPKRKTPASLTLLRGGLSVAVAPLRRLEILLQVQNTQNIKCKDIIQGLHHLRGDGFRGLFKGNGAYIVHAISSTTADLVVSSSLARITQLHRQKPGKENAKPPILLTLGSQGCAMMIATSAAYPMDMARGRLSVQTGKSPDQYRGICHALSTIAREEGPRALYKGCLPFTIGRVLSLYLNFFVFESLRISSTRDIRRRLIEAAKVSDFTELKPEDIKPEMQEDMLAVKKKLPFFHLFAAAVGFTFAYPFDVIHRRMQMGGWKNPSSIIACDGNNKAAMEFTGMCDAFKKTIRNDGFKALYKGSIPGLLVKVLPAAVVSVMHQGLMEGLGLEVNVKV